MSSGGTFVDRIDPFANRKSLKKKPKKSQGSSRYRTGGDVELTALPLLKGNLCPLNLPLLNNVVFTWVYIFLKNPYLSKARFMRCF